MQISERDSRRVDFSRGRVDIRLVSHGCSPHTHRIQLPRRWFMNSSCLLSRGIRLFSKTAGLGEKEPPSRAADHLARGIIPVLFQFRCVLHCRCVIAAFDVRVAFEFRSFSFPFFSICVSDVRATTARFPWSSCGRPSVVIGGLTRKELAMQIVQLAVRIVFKSGSFSVASSLFQSGRAFTSSFFLSFCRGRQHVKNRQEG